ncbi:hypothetical protein Tco_1357833, partial [Tanacetum coccineum]
GTRVEALLLLLLKALTPEGKGIMVDDVVAPSGGVSRPRSSSGPVSSFRDVFVDAIHTEFFPFFDGPYYATYPEDGVARNYECVALYDDVTWCLKGYEEKVATLTGLELQVSTLKKQVSGLNDKLATFDASFSKSKAKGKEKKIKIKSLTKTKRDEEILRLKATPLEFSSFIQGQFQGLVRKFLASDEFSRVQGELLSLGASAGFEHGLSIDSSQIVYIIKYIS